MSHAYDIGLKPPTCNGCSLAKSRWELGDKFLLLPSGVYELDAKPNQGQGQPKSHNGQPIRFIWWGMGYDHSDECYHWKPPSGVKGEDENEI